MKNPIPDDLLGRSLHDLRISVTDRCNFRCRYCMPAAEFGPNYQFLPREEILSFEEIVRLAGIASSMGVGKLRLTGGEPLLRRNIEDLVAMLAAIDGIGDLAMTTNGVLLAHHAESLALAGLKRVTVSLDALDPEIFAQMNGVGARVDRVLAGISTAQAFGLPVKVNAVIQRGVNDGEILPLAAWAREQGVNLRFIEFMDVGETNHWDGSQVVTAAEVLLQLRRHFNMEPLPVGYPGETASRWKYTDGAGEIGIIASVSRPFCRGCNRIRLSADGHLFTCLFAGQGHDLRPALRGGGDDDLLRKAIQGIWAVRNDRYSELRGTLQARKSEMSYLGG